MALYADNGQTSGHTLTILVYLGILLVQFHMCGGLSFLQNVFVYFCQLLESLLALISRTLRKGFLFKGLNRRVDQRVK